MKKKFYQRKRLWIPLVLLIIVALPFILNPLKSFQKTVRWGLRFYGIHERATLVGTYRLHFYEGGVHNPETVILLHGFGGNALFTWMRLMPALSKKYHVIAPDLLASNFLYLNPRGYSVDSEVDLVLKVMESTKIHHASFVGFSMGGWVSLILALEHPEKIDRLILVESAGIDMEIPELVRLILTDRDQARKFMNLLFYRAPPLPGFVLDQFVKASTGIKTKYEAVFTGFIENSKTRLLDDRLGEIYQPTLIIHGREDQVIPLKIGQRLHQLIPHSEMIILEKSGHGAMWDTPSKLKRAIQDFLEKNLKNKSQLTQ